MDVLWNDNSGTSGGTSGGTGGTSGTSSATQNSVGLSYQDADDTHHACPALHSVPMSVNFNKVIRAMNYKRRDSNDPRENRLFDDVDDGRTGLSFKNASPLSSNIATTNLHSSQVRVLNELGGKSTFPFRSPMDLMSQKSFKSSFKSSSSSRSFDQFSPNSGSSHPFNLNSNYRSRRSSSSPSSGSNGSNGSNGSSGASGASSSSSSSSSKMTKEVNENAMMVSRAAAKISMDKNTLNEIIKEVNNSNNKPLVYTIILVEDFYVYNVL